MGSVNPATDLLEVGRDIISGQPARLALAFSTAALLVAVSLPWSLHDLRKAKRAG